MTSAPLPASSPARRSARCTAIASSLADRARAGKRGADHRPGALARYVDWRGRAREVVIERGLAGSVLVVDRSTRGEDSRLLAHLGADEPPENALLVCEDYLKRARRERCRARALTSSDTCVVPFADERAAEQPSVAESGDVEPLDGRGCRYRLQLLKGGMSIAELRWCQHRPGEQGQWRPVSVREVVAQLQDYEPVRAITVRALARYRGDGEVSTTVLRAELERVQGSPILLNRKLREMVLAIVERERLSMSEIAIRCGRVKRDRAGNESGETSWLARRLGILPEGGRSAPTPWVHSDVLALIARRGLGISPREVELG